MASPKQKKSKKTSVANQTEQISAFETPTETIESSPVTQESEVADYVTQQTSASWGEREMQGILSILDGHSPEDRKAILKSLLQREKIQHNGEGNQKDADNEINPNWKDGAYPYKNRMSTKRYEKEKYLLQVELLKLQSWVKETGQKVVILFEGRDAAGKGGTIRRFMEHLNPRGARVVALEKPTVQELGQWYFQRYITHLPTAGEMGV